MRVTIVCPVPAGSRLGNRITAVRWRAILESLGHRVRVATESGGNGDVLVALHAYKTAEAVRAFRAAHPARPIVVALTGTDLYRDIHVHAEARRSLELADRLVVLHDQAARALPRAMRRKVRLIRQSAEPAARKARRSATFDVAFVAHLRAEKDPLRAAIAARALARSSRVRIVHAGRALTDDFRARAEREQAENARYVWLGEIASARARRLIATSRVLVLTSHTEGGANVLGEAIMSATPVIASRIPAAVSALGGGYRGFFPPGDTRALTRLLARAESDRPFLQELTRATRARRPLFAPSAERAAWRALLGEIT
ncbi:MAG TPA: selenoneine biosynthesis selenosugar synthase SenB [Polyangiaceae bacterium]